MNSEEKDKNREQNEQEWRRVSMKPGWKFYKEHLNWSNMEDYSMDDYWEIVYNNLRYTGVNYFNRTYYGPNRYCSIVLIVLSNVLFLISILRGLTKPNPLPVKIQLWDAVFVTIMMLVKIFNLVWYNVGICETKNQLTQVFDGLKGSEDKEAWRIFYVRLRFVNRLVKLVNVGVNAATLIGTINGIVRMELFVPINFFVYDVPDSKACLLFNLTVQFLMALECSSMVVGLMSMYLNIVFMLTGTIEVLCYLIENIGNPSKPHTSTSRYITKLILMHQWIINLHLTFNKVLRIDCMVEIAFSTLIGCLTLHQLVNGGDAMLYIPYTLVVGFQFGIRCYAGELVTSGGNQLCESIVLSNWENIDVSLVKMCKFMLTISQRPIHTSGVFFNANMKTLSMILQNIYSFFTVLSASEK